MQRELKDRSNQYSELFSKFNYLSQVETFFISFKINKFKKNKNKKYRIMNN